MHGNAHPLGRGIYSPAGLVLVDRRGSGGNEAAGDGGRDARGPTAVATGNERSRGSGGSDGGAGDVRGPAVLAADGQRSDRGGSA